MRTFLRWRWRIEEVGLFNFFSEYESELRKEGKKGRNERREKKLRCVNVIGSLHSVALIAATYLR